MGTPNTTCFVSDDLEIRRVLRNYKKPSPEEDAKIREKIIRELAGDEAYEAYESKYLLKHEVKA